MKESDDSFRVPNAPLRLDNAWMRGGYENLAATRGTARGAAATPVKTGKSVCPCFFCEFEGCSPRVRCVLLVALSSIC